MNNIFIVEENLALAGEEVSEYNSKGCRRGTVIFPGINTGEYNGIHADIQSLSSCGVHLDLIQWAVRVSFSRCWSFNERITAENGLQWFESIEMIRVQRFAMSLKAESVEVH